MLMEIPQHTNTKKLINNKGNRKPRGRRSSPKAEQRQTGKKDPHAYIWKDKSLGELAVLNTANAWWLDGVKVQQLVDAYKFYATDDQACYYAGISIDQLKYFQEQHPDFYTIKHLAKQDPTLRAKKTIVNAIEKDKEMAKWWASRLEKDTFSTRTENTGADGRDLFDKISKDYKNLIEKVRKDDKGFDTDEEHASEQDAVDPNARQGGDRDDTAPATDEDDRQGDSARLSK